MRKPTIPTNLPHGAFGFIVTRPDRAERLALYRADGSLNCSFAQDATLADARGILATAGFDVCEGGFVVKRA